MGMISVSIDFDEITCYHAIHGLDKPVGPAAEVVYSRALPRAVKFLEEHKIPGTLFVVGSDISKGGEPASAVRSLHAGGHEIANHSMNHRYDLTLLSQASQVAEIVEAEEAITQVTGVRPKGFRAPGYNVHLGLTDILKDRGYLYDSSVFPCPLYFTAKAAAVGAKTMQGQRSSSVIGDPRILGAPTGPYKIGSDGVWTKGNGLIELPISVVTGARLPFIGTSIVMMGNMPAKLLARAAARMPFVNLELHGIDFVDADGDGLGHLKRVQPDLRIPLTKRKRTLSLVVKALTDAGLEPVTLADAAKRIFI